MDNAGYATLTRQSALMSELRLVANNVANASTTGFRREGIVFSEFVVDLGKEAPSMSMARAASAGDLGHPGRAEADRGGAGLRDRRAGILPG